MRFTRRRRIAAAFFGPLVVGAVLAGPAFASPSGGNAHVSSGAAMLLNQPQADITVTVKNPLLQDNPGPTGVLQPTMNFIRISPPAGFSFLNYSGNASWLPSLRGSAVELRPATGSAGLAGDKEVALPLRLKAPTGSVDVYGNIRTFLSPDGGLTTLYESSAPTGKSLSIRAHALDLSGVEVRRPDGTSATTLTAGQTTAGVRGIVTNHAATGVVGITMKTAPLATDSVTPPAGVTLLSGATHTYGAGNQVPLSVGTAMTPASRAPSVQITSADGLATSRFVSPTAYTLNAPLTLTPTTGTAADVTPSRSRSSASPTVGLSVQRAGGVSGTIDPALSSVTFKATPTVGTKLVGTISATQTVGVGPGTSVLNSTPLDLAGLAGFQEVSLLAAGVDSNGATFSQTVPMRTNFNVDDAPLPVLPTLTGPKDATGAAATTVGRNSTLTFGGTVGIAGDDVAGVTCTLVTYDGAAELSTTPVTCARSSSAALSGTGSVGSAPAADGATTVKLHVVATDSAGNLSEGFSPALLLDALNPRIQRAETGCSFPGTLECPEMSTEGRTLRLQLSEPVWPLPVALDFKVAFGAQPLEVALVRPADPTQLVEQAVDELVLTLVRGMLPDWTPTITYGGVLPLVSPAKDAVGNPLIANNVLSIDRIAPLVPQVSMSSTGGRTEDDSSGVERTYTSDTTPTFTFSGVVPGETLKLIPGGATFSTSILSADPVCQVIATSSSATCSPVLAEGDINLYAISQDVAGNYSRQHVGPILGTSVLSRNEIAASGINVGVDTTAPTADWSRAGDVITVAFSEPVSGRDSRPEWFACTNEVTGSASCEEVTVTAIGGSGDYRTLQLAANSPAVQSLVYRPTSTGGTEYTDRAGTSVLPVGTQEYLVPQP
ncbi:MAG TPA: hypothetical protein VNA30_00835 [Mycobacteriales bacterium]|nr:hypothetical protein [Mycobacteriales bacterium]